MAHGEPVPLLRADREADVSGDENREGAGGGSERSVSLDNVAGGHPN